MSAVRHVGCTKGWWITSERPRLSRHFQHIRAPVMCQMLHPRIIILPTADPKVAMATVSVIVSVVLAGCSYGNNVCNSGSVHIKPSQM